MENLQQYVIRPHVRIFGVPVSENERSENVERCVKDIISQTGMDIPHESIDRAHRVGKPKVKEGITTQPIIVRFSTFRDRTKFYKKRKDIPNKYGVVLDLTRERLAILKEARRMIENVDGIKFVYTDINCNLRAFTSGNKHVLFKSIGDLQGIIENL